MSKADIDFIFNAVMKDTDALEDAKATLQIIKNIDPNVYDEIINESIAAIDKALNNCIFSAIGRILGDEEWYITNEEETMNTVGDGSNGYPITPIRLKKEWVGLTDEERIQVAIDSGCMSADWINVVEAVEAILKEKNSD
jgi:hypothetical protein